MGLLSWLFGTHTAPAASSASRSESRPEPLPRGRYGQDRHSPPGEWVQATHLLQVAGITHRKANAMSFATAVALAEAGGRRYGIRLEPEPDNAHDKNALKVIGAVDGKEWHVGYVDAETARDVTEDLLARGLPIAGQLFSIWIGYDDYIEIKIFVLAPPGNSEKARRNRNKRA